MSKLYLYAIAAVALAGGLWWVHNHLVDKGIAQQQAADAKAYARLQRDADLETGRLNGLADAAEHAHDQELTDLRQYRADHPLHGSLRVNCLPATPRGEASASNPIDGGTSTQPGPVQSVPEGNSGGLDQLHLLDILAGKADEVSGQLREWQAR